MRLNPKEPVRSHCAAVEPDVSELDSRPRPTQDQAIQQQGIEALFAEQTQAVPFAPTGKGFFTERALQPGSYGEEGPLQDCLA